MRIRELIKSIILITLVLSSIVLTVMIWNFSPDLTNIDNSQTKETTKSIGPRFDAEVEQAVTPLQMVHVHNDKIEGTPATSEVTNLTQLFDKQHVKEVVYIENEQALLLRDVSNHFLVLDYPTDIPLSMYLSDVLDVQAKVPSDFTFDRLLYDIDSEDNLVIYALQPDRHRAIQIKTTVKASDVKSRIDRMNSSLEPYTNITTNQDTINKATYVYAQKEPKKLKSYRTIFNHISVEDLNAILFDDTPIVRTTNSGNTIYNNNTGVVNYDANKKTYHYTNLSEDEQSTRDMNISIPRTFDYINKHGGFTDDFRLFNTNSHQGEITYQMFFNGRPIFYPNQLNQIHVIWGERGIFEYSRGLLKTNATISNSEKSKSLPAVESVRSELASNNTLDFGKIEQMIVGYKMISHKGPDEQLEIQENSRFEPRWYIKYAGEWYEYDDGELIEQ
ncbi:YycH family regulatory protein [Staphylococcus sp. 17KM0847]|uniref:YycH family regulatory protein n=1 Tax=Staphylococcus sp. 17KM0847 TaxID=2583989 RepID=UPI0015DCA698|nr:two-component system activity regulator YycH [Staphylococcus sp. 17KM0847]QLK85225.1 hypothetical protein FGL66_00120 [Staphylococcus sp. 17KM0847]